MRPTFFVPDGPRAEALLSLVSGHRGLYVGGLPGKIAVFTERIYGLPYVAVAVRVGPPPSLRAFEPPANPFETTHQKEMFEAQILTRGRDRMYAYVNQPRHLEEFLETQGAQYTVVVSDVERRALPPMGAP